MGDVEGREAFMLSVEGDRMTYRAPLSGGADGSSGQLGARGTETIHNRLICK